jgi:hypothetical protein
MEVKEHQDFWVIIHHIGSEHLYPKDQYTKEQAIFDDLFLTKIQLALTYALKQVKDETTRHLIAQEFWNSLNRKGLIPNDMVETLIEWTTQ